MTARDHTARFLAWWCQVGIKSADMAIRRSNNTWIWHRNVPLTELPLGWARAENMRRSEVYVRPARGFEWPLVFLDDLTVAQARMVARRVPALSVHTSPAGGCQLWMFCRQALNEQQRYNAQRILARRLGGDPGSTSGEHLGRLAGVKNWKRNGVWVNVLEATNSLPALNVMALVHGEKQQRQEGGHEVTGCVRGIDTSESSREWGWVCGSLEAGLPPEAAFRALVERARPRRGADAERYARRTVARALMHTRFSPPQGAMLFGTVLESKRGGESSATRS